MFESSFDEPFNAARWRVRTLAFAIVLLMSLTACSTGPRGGAVLRDSSPTPQETVFVELAVDHAPVRVDTAEWASALTALWLELPMSLTASHTPLYVDRRLAMTFATRSDEASRSGLCRDYQLYCERRDTPGDCLTVFEDGPHFQDDDKRRLALALAVGPALAGLDAEARTLLDPTRVLATLSIGITGYMALLLAPVPEPVTKGIALAFTVLLWGYLGWEFFDLLEAYAQLHEQAPRASSFNELLEIGARFGRVVGPNSIRILVVVGTAAVGGTVALAARGSKLPGFAQASEAVATSTGLHLMRAATGAERILVSVPQGTLHLVGAPQVVAMAARKLSGNGPSPRGKLLPNGHRAWGSYSGFKSAMGPAGPGKQWHHIMEQTPGNLKRFGGDDLHNTENVIALDATLHSNVSRLYSSIRWRITGSHTLTVRQWLSGQSYAAQRAFGLRAITNVRNGVW